MMQMAKPMPGERGGQTPTLVQPSLGCGCGEQRSPPHQHRGGQGFSYL